MKIMDVNKELHQMVSGRVKFDTENNDATAICFLNGSKIL